MAKLVKGSVGRILTKMTIPMVFGIGAVVAFNFVDTLFVGWLGTKELAALSFTFPVVLVINSLALGLGTGVSAVVSKAIGSGSIKKVKRLTTDSLLLSVLVVTFFALVGVFTINPLFSLLGATADILPLIHDYMFIWYLGVIFVIVPMVGNSAIRATGDTKIPSLIMIFAVAINVVLDPIMIFGLWGFPRLALEGAAIATVIARAGTMIFSLGVLIFREKMITFRWEGVKEIIKSWRAILDIGLPVAATRVILPIGVGIITRLVAIYGVASVAALGVATRVEFFGLAVIFALTSALGPFVGQNWAAKLKDRVRLGIKLSNRFAMIWGLALFIIFAILGRPIAVLFNGDPEVVFVAGQYLMIVPISYGLLGVLQNSSTVLNIINKPISAALLLVLQAIIYIPLAVLGAKMYGLIGIFIAISVGIIISGIVSKRVLDKFV